MMLRHTLLLLCLAGPLLGSDAGSLAAPPNAGGPLVIDASFHLNKIISINDKEETFTIAGLLKMHWKDPRLAFDPASSGQSEKFHQGAGQFNEVPPWWFPQIALKNPADALTTDVISLRVKPDGTCTLVSALRISARSDFVMRKYPLDSHALAAVFTLPGISAEEIVFQSCGTSSEADAGISQWIFRGTRGETRVGTTPEWALILDVERDWFFAVRLLAIPLFLIVILSWSVFWMEKSSVGDRLGLTFVGILTAVAYQIVIGDLLPDVSYVTLMHGFVNISFLMMCATVVVNLMVAHCDKSGRSALGDAIDRRCRVVFPSVYLGLIILISFIAVIFFR
jgi:Neurotransmitter-gated ion-channel ligand binding domain